MTSTTSLSAGELAALRERATYDATHWQNAVLSHEEFATLLAAAEREAALAARVATLRRRVPASLLSNEDLTVEFDAAWERFKAAREGDGHSGSPGEGDAERMDEIQTEQRRRAALAPKEAGHVD